MPRLSKKVKKEKEIIKLKQSLGAYRSLITRTENKIHALQKELNEMKA